MTQLSRRWSTERLLVVVALVATVGGAVVGTAVGYGFHYEARQTRKIYLFNNGLDFNETTFGLPHDTFTPDHMTVNKGDTVVIHYINIEDKPEKHNFSINAPYNIDVDVEQGQTANITFTANYAGIFLYYCKFHTPTMEGYLSVQG